VGRSSSGAKEVPEGVPLVLSAHGAAPQVYANAASQGLQTIDATCPLVSKVHAEARLFASRGYTVFLVGHAGHEEVVGTMGEAPDSIVLVETAADAERVRPSQTGRLAFITQTTLSVDDTSEIVGILRRRFPGIEAPEKDDICYATTNRQRAVKRLLGRIELLLVVGSPNSSNSNRLVDVAQARGIEAHLIDDEGEIEEDWLEGVETVGLTSGASAPQSLVRRVIDWFRERGVTHVEELEAPAENVSFRLPREVRWGTTSS
jgi:4-hydroxy-3-methylbut-2-enyl diphosphate reductase